MVIQIDSREKPKAIEKIVGYFDAHNVQHFTSKLDVGDYMSLDNPRVIIDRKMNLMEVATNIVQQHDRFVREMERARDYGVQLIILVEHSPIVRRVEDVERWTNPRKSGSQSAISDTRMMKAMRTISEKYGVYWEFCTKSQTGKRIIDLLSCGNTAPTCCDRSSFEIRQIGNLPFLCCTYCKKPHHVISKRELQRGI